ncbi:SpoIID/LytB domain-containing protein [Mangrovibacterium marinum]|uniref:SpoIID/LytB domain protein n=1 Tax=Mangrovibacterium marinum TaxID=1639118 RepID=A0A2T5BZH0_9BACT|nr:SpoIID/LytB domain-containing protein [Mangrovibacterium marinum]PTN07680.1 SpoIID/LytB domain protein [Mangrovibacterium marinum]
MNQPQIQVGIMAEPVLRFELKGDYQGPAGSGGTRYKATIHRGEIVLSNQWGIMLRGREFVFKPTQDSASFLLKSVTIGIDFHWEQKQDLEFRGSLKLLIDGGKIQLINQLPLEEYLRSVISSEMSASSSPELLKAHAVISRSWLMAQIEKSKKLESQPKSYETNIDTDSERIRWYDREDHRLFDVCADDHCQRYQGISRIISDKANAAIDATSGQFLVSDDQICDARFSKCCGGISENFENVWEPVHHPYLSKVVDAENGGTTCVDLRQEDEAERWIRSSPQAFCNTNNRQVLEQILPDFDQKTKDFYRWQVSYSQSRLAWLIHQRTGIDFGHIIRLEAVSRGHSGRIIKLKITGSKQCRTIGKELEIRRALSQTHLYSSAFVIDHRDIQDGIPQQFVLTGAGWGHGVGLCQIGAAMMGEQGYSYQQILAHYFRGAELKTLY